MKKNKLNKIPIVVQLYPQQVHEADLMRELKIDKLNLDREMRRQPSRYAFWAALYSVVAAKVAFLQEKLERTEARLFIRYAKAGVAKRVSDIKFHVIRNSEYAELKSKLRRWQDSERILKYSAMRGFEQRTFMLQALAANKRREWDSEVNTKKKHREED